MEIRANRIDGPWTHDYDIANALNSVGGKATFFLNVSYLILSISRGVMADGSRVKIMDVSTRGLNRSETFPTRGTLSVHTLGPMPT